MFRLTVQRKHSRPSTNGFVESLPRGKLVWTAESLWRILTESLCLLDESMFSRRLHKPLTLMTALLLLIQCVVGLPGACACGGAAEAQSASDSCCQLESQSGNDEKTFETATIKACCGTAECQCGDQCGSTGTGCECSCQNQRDEPIPAQERQQRSDEDVKSAATIRDINPVVLTIADDRTPRVTSHSAHSVTTRVQIMLCTWRT